MTVATLQRRLREIDRELMDLCPWKVRAAELHRERVAVVAKLEGLRSELAAARDPGGAPPDRRS